jgi:hypothetical protein
MENGNGKYVFFNGDGFLKAFLSIVCTEASRYSTAVEPTVSRLLFLHVSTRVIF